MEGADIFRFGYGSANVRRNLGWSDPSFFYSRRIGRSPQGHVPLGDVINGHVEAGYQSFHPGKVFRNWKVTFATYRYGEYQIK